MTPEVTKIKDGTVVLPKAMRKLWQNADMVTRVTADTVLIMRVQSRLCGNTWKRLGKVGQSVTPNDIERAVRARKFLFSPSKEPHFP